MENRKKASKKRMSTTMTEHLYRIRANQLLERVLDPEGLAQDLTCRDLSGEIMPGYPPFTTGCEKGKLLNDIYEFLYGRVKLVRSRDSHDAK